MVTILAFISYVESLPFNGNLVICNPGRHYRNRDYCFETLNNLFGVVLVFGERLALEFHGEAFSA